MGNISNQPLGKKEEIAARRVTIFDLRRGGASLRMIAQRVGVSHETVAKDLAAVLKELNKASLSSADELREMELARLDMAALAIQKSVSAGHLGAIDRWLRIMERRAKLLGLDKPTKIEGAGDNGEIVIKVVYQDK